MYRPTARNPLADRMFEKRFDVNKDKHVNMEDFAQLLQVVAKSAQFKDNKNQEDL